MRGAQCLRFSLSSAKYSPAPAHRDPFYDLVPMSPNGVAKFFACLGLYAYPAGTSFCSCKRKQNTLGENPETPDAWLRWIRMLFFCWHRKTNPYGAQMRSKGSLRRLVGRNLRFNRADPPLHCGQPSPLRCVLLSPQGLTTLQGPQKPARWSAKGEPPPLSCPCRSKVALLRFLARIAPVAPQGIVAVSATGGAPIPCPSEEGNYSAGRLILFSLFPLSSANLVPAPSHRDPLASKAPTISQTRKLFVKFCVNSTLSLQIFLVSSGLVRGTSLTGKYLPHSDLCRRSLSSFAFPIFPRARLYARGISIQPKGGRRFVPCCPRGGGKNHLPFR